MSTAIGALHPDRISHSAVWVLRGMGGGDQVPPNGTGLLLLLGTSYMPLPWFLAVCLRVRGDITKTGANERRKNAIL